MARQQATLSTLPTALIEALHETLTLKPADDSQRIAQSEMVKALQTALDADASVLLSANLPSARLNGRGFCFRDSARWSLSPWFTAITDAPAL